MIELWCECGTCGKLFKFIINCIIKYLLTLMFLLLCESNVGKDVKRIDTSYLKLCFIFSFKSYAKKLFFIKTIDKTFVTDRDHSSMIILIIIIWWLTPVEMSIGGDAYNRYISRIWTSWCFVV